ncbi:MAG: sulfatase [Acidobacteriota bacterium]
MTRRAILSTLATLAVVAVVLGCLPGDAGPDATRRPNILLISVDTLRADHLGAYGYDRATSPRLDRLAARGTRFADCTVQWPKTWPSMASMLTGAHPKTIGVTRAQHTLHGGVETLAERFREHGFATAAVVANVNLSDRFGFSQGFDHFVESWSEARRETNGPVQHSGGVKRYTNARVVSDQGLAWLRDVDRSRPWFLWLHYIDPHGPYQPPAAYADRFTDRPYPTRDVPDEHMPRYQQQVDADGEPIRALGHYLANYDREIRFFDDEMGRLLDAIEAAGFARDETLIVFTADHGESFGEHEYWLEHGLLPYQSTAHVPLILAYDGVVPSGRVVERPVGLIDLAPTLVELAGLDPMATFEGRSLVPTLTDDQAGPRYVFMESGYHEATQLAIREGSWKLVLVRADDDRQRMTGEEVELYDLSIDPGELVNVASEHPERTTRLRKTLEAWYRSGVRAVDVGGELDIEALDPEEREQLRALGYID